MGAAGIGAALGALGALSSLGSTSSTGSTGSTYDFTSMTNQQFLTAIRQLGGEGKISQTDESQLSFIAQGVDSTPINRADQPSEQQIMGNPTAHDFLNELQNIDWSANKVAGSVGAPMFNSMLKDLQTYQGTSSTQQTGHSLSVQA
ncbi:MAG TPA: hypothetical protein VHZ09_07685 [Acidobacteriaceae bacterium]|jgi:hypothetical protein|nr:hypothetical protein [Acidobacteriaceae bacterium]